MLRGELTAILHLLSPLSLRLSEVSAYEKRRSASPPAATRQPKKRKGFFKYESVLPREETVSSLYQKLQKHKWIHVRGTPGSGKTVLARLLERYIEKMEPLTEIFHYSQWNSTASIPSYPLGSVLILDEAQATYPDKEFWNRFKNPEVQSEQVIAFASHGSSAHTGAHPLTPLWVAPNQRVGLAPVDNGDGISVGLLFTREDFYALVPLRFSDNRFCPSFLDCVFDMTMGHIGACLDVLQMIIAHPSYREDKTASYTYDKFITAVPMGKLLQAIYTTTVFSRGLPSESLLRSAPGVTALFREAILTNGIAREYEYLASDPKDDDGPKKSLREIFLAGWLHTEIVPVRGVVYTFPSPLHKRCIERMINGSPEGSKIIESNVTEFALAVIGKFSHRSLSYQRILGPNEQSTPEAQFQDEFYRASFKHANGCAVSFPECGTGKGRIDFFIESKKWGVELLRNGNRLTQHIKRFRRGEYGRWFEKGWMSDYIIIDFRTEHPKTYEDNKKLFYVVSDDNWVTAVVLDNVGTVVRRYCLGP